MLEVSNGQQDICIQRAILSRENVCIHAYVYTRARGPIHVRASFMSKTLDVTTLR